MCACFSDLPVELHRLILSFVSDSFSLHRLERVCVLWNELVAERERRGFKFRKKKVRKNVCSIANNQSFDLIRKANGSQQWYKEAA